MASRSPSLLALLGLAAVAGYQNRDKLGEMFRDVNPGTGPRQDTPASGGSGGLMAVLRDLGLEGIMGQQANTASTGGLGGGLGGVLARGIGDLVDAFREAGPQRPTPADSWVSREANQPVDERTLEITLGDDMLRELTHRTGMNRGEILARLAAVLPGAVDAMTPEGALPEAPEQIVLAEPRQTSTSPSGLSPW